MISDRFEDLAQSLRVFSEQRIRFRDLLLVDANEAIGNVELAMKGMLDCFHSLYDSASKDERIDFDFYAHPFCTFVLQYRNAKHHNRFFGIRSVYRMAASLSERRDFLLVDFPAAENEEGGSFIDHFVSWADFSNHISNLPGQYVEQTKRLIQGGLSNDRFEEFAQSHGYPEDCVFFNAIPIIMRACSEWITCLEPHITPRSTEASYFLMHFQSVGSAQFSNPDYLELSSGVFAPSRS